MKWFGFGILAFLCLLLVGVGSASLVRSPDQCVLPVYEIKPLRDQLGFEWQPENTKPGNFNGLADEIHGYELKKVPGVLDTEFQQLDLRSVELERIADLSYGPHGHRNLLDIYLPSEREKPTPVVVWIHGGGGEKGEAPADTMNPLLQRGYAIAQINYRRENMGDAAFETEQEFDFPAQIEDSKAAVRFLRAHAEDYGLDPSRIGASGFSMGGYLTSLLCTTSDTDLYDDGPNSDQSSSIQAACAWGAITDMRVSSLQSNFHMACFSNRWAFLNQSLGDVYYSKNNAEFAEQISPITYASSSDPPILLITGFNDGRTNPHQANSLYIRLRNAGVDAESLIVAGADHGGGTLFNAKTRTKAAEFFDRHLRPR